MSTIPVTLPEDLKAFVEAEAAAGGYETPGEFVQQVLRAAWREKKKAELEATLIAAMESGPPIEVTDEFWEQMKSRVSQRCRERQATISQSQGERPADEPQP